MNREQGDILVSPPRCGKILRVPERSNSLLQPGDYPCTLPTGHEPAEIHACVLAWGEVQFPDSRARG